MTPTILFVSPFGIDVSSIAQFHESPLPKHTRQVTSSPLFFPHLLIEPALHLIPKTLYHYALHLPSSDSQYPQTLFSPPLPPPHLCNASNKYLRFSSPTRIYNSELDPTSESVDTGLRRLTTPRYVSKRVCRRRNRSFVAFMLLGLLVGLFTIYVENGVKYRKTGH